MDIVIDLQAEVLNNDSDILSLLRKAKLISRKLKLKSFEKWVEDELNGYEELNDIPQYRKVSGEVKAWNPYRGWIPIIFADTEFAEMLNTRILGHSVSILKSLLESDSEMVVIGFTDSQNNIISKGSDFEAKYYLHVAKNSIIGIIERVKNEILEWSIILEENGIIGENLKFTNEEVTIAQNSTQITNYISNFYGNISKSQIQQATHNSSQNK